MHFRGIIILVKKELKQGILQAAGITLYCSLVAIVMWRGNEIFGKVDSYLGPVAVLVMLSVSVLICGIIVFYKPYKLFFAGKKKEAADVVISTAISLFAILLILFSALFFYK